MKILGSLFIFTASIGFAFQIKTDLKRHLFLLYDIRKLLLDIADEMAYSLESVETVLKYTVQSKNRYLNEICKAMGEILEKKEAKNPALAWETVILEYQKKLQLKEAEKDVFADAGNAFFGKSIEENERALKHSIKRLDAIIDVAEKEQKEKQKVYQTVSVMCGLIVILLFL